MVILMKNELNDEELILRFQNGDRAAYTQLVNKYRDRIINFIFRFVGDMDSAQDLAQDTFFKFYQKKDSYKQIAKFSTWLYTIAANLAKTELRKIKRRKTSTVSDLSKNDYEFTIVDTEEDNEMDIKEAYFLEKSILDLDVEFRTIIILREIQELSYESISKILKLPLGTVKSRINRGKLKLRDLLNKRGVNR